MISQAQPSTAYPSATGATRVGPGRGVLALGALIVFALLLAYLSLFRDALIDDAFIQLKYSQTLATSGTWGFFPGRLTNTATSPLNVLLTAAAGLLAPTMIDGVVWLTALELLLTLGCLAGISRRLFGTPYFAVIAFVGLIANPLLMSTIGLEGTLLTLGITASLYCFVSARWMPLAIVLALLTMTRADAGLLFLVFVVALPVPMRTRIQFALVYAAALVPWHLYSWIHLGSVIPDTMKIKMFQRSWGAGMTFQSGPLVYLRLFPVATAFSVALLGGGLGLLWRASRPVRAAAALILAYGVLHFLAYTAIRVPPYHWYYVNQVVPCVLIGALGIASLVQQQSRGGPVPLWGWLAAAAPAVGIAILATQLGVPFREVPIHSNWAPHAAYRDMGLWLKAHTAPQDGIFIAGEIGTLAFYSERLLINEFSDMNRVSEPILAGEYDNRPLIGRLLRLNFYWRRLQKPDVAIQYFMQGGTVNAAREAAVKQTSIQTWVVSSRFMDRLRPGSRTLYWFKPLERELAARPAAE